jgi:hypothetical protein
LQLRVNPNKNNETNFLKMNATTQPHWIARSIGSSVITPVLLVSVVAVTLWLLLLESPASQGSQLVLIVGVLGAVGLGCAALAWIRPQRAGLSPPHVMLSLGFGGMLLGLVYDLAHEGPARLDSLCAQTATLGFMDSLRLHIEFLPGMHVGMLIGGLLAIPGLRMLRSHCGRYLCSLFFQNVMCSGWMLVGMTTGALWLARWQTERGESSLPGMLGSMFVGMTWGMVVSVALYRSYFTLRNRAAGNQKAV